MTTYDVVRVRHDVVRTRTTSCVHTMSHVRCRTSISCISHVRHRTYDIQHTMSYVARTMISYVRTTSSVARTQMTVVARVNPCARAAIAVAAPAVNTDTAIGWQWPTKTCQWCVPSKTWGCHWARLRLEPETRARLGTVLVWVTVTRTVSDHSVTWLRLGSPLTHWQHPPGPSREVKLRSIITTSTLTPGPPSRLGVCLLVPPLWQVGLMILSGTPTRYIVGIYHVYTIYIPKGCIMIYLV